MPLRSLHHVGMPISPPRALCPSWTALRLRNRRQYLHSLRLHRHGVSGRRRLPLGSGRTFSPDTPPPPSQPPSDLDRRPSRPLLVVALITHSIHPLLADVLESCRPSFRGVGGGCSSRSRPLANGTPSPPQPARFLRTITATTPPSARPWAAVVAGSSPSPHHACCRDSRLLSLLTRVPIVSAPSDPRSSPGQLHSVQRPNLHRHR